MKIIFIVSLLIASNMLSAQILSTTNGKPKANIYLEENFDTEIPGTWTVIDGGTDTTTWAYTDPADNYNFELDGTSYVRVTCELTMADLDEILESPAFDASAASGVVLEFDQVFSSWGAHDDTCDVFVWDGTQWINVLKQAADDNIEDIGYWGDPDHQSINITAYKNSAMKIRFQYRTVTPYQYEWAIDNVIVQETVGSDMVMRNVSPEFCVVGNDYTPIVTVRNDGALMEDDYDVNVTISQGVTVVYNQTMNLTAQNLASGDSISITFTTPWSNGSIGSYSLEATVTASGDGDATNDSIIMPVSIIGKPIYPAKAYAINSTDHTFESVDLTNGTMTVISSSPSGLMPVALTFIDSTLYCLDFMGKIALVTPNGNFFNVGKVSGFPSSTFPKGLTYDYSSGTVYTSNFNFDNDFSGLFSLSMNTLQATLIGYMLNKRISSIEVASGGIMYALCPSDDSLYQVNTTTGFGSPINDFGIEIGESGRHDLAWNFEDSTLWGLLNSATGNGLLGTLNTSTGLFSEVANFPAKQYCGFAINKYYTPSSSIDKNEPTNLFVYPNPASDFITVNTGDVFSKITISDMSGRVVLEQNILSDEEIGISSLSPNVYIVTLSNVDEFKTLKLVIK